MTPVASTNAETLARIETKLDVLTASMNDIARTQAVQEHRITQVECDNEELEKDVKANGKAISENTRAISSLRDMVKGLVWASGVIGASIITWVVANVLGLIA